VSPSSSSSSSIFTCTLIKPPLLSFLSCVVS
jgi:hypothetical protein